MSELVEHTLNPVAGPVPASLVAFCEEGLRRAKGIDCFDFVPSNYAVLYSVLAALPRGRFCEWGSGIGVVTGLAERLGFQAIGIERSSELADASRQWFAECQISAAIICGSYFDTRVAADVYFVYCWPGQMNEVLAYFARETPRSARLLVAYGAEDVRLLTKTGVE